MKPTVVFIHTVCGLKPLFDGVLGCFCQTVDTCHIADETLIRSILAAGGLTPAIRRHELRENSPGRRSLRGERHPTDMFHYLALRGGTGSLVKARLLSIDEPMAEEAVARFERIGVVATNPATLRPSAGPRGREGPAASTRSASRVGRLRKRLCGVPVGKRCPARRHREKRSTPLDGFSRRSAASPGEHDANRGCDGAG